MSRTVKQVASVAVLALAMVANSVAIASATPAGAREGARWQCARVGSHGQLCIRFDPNGYDVEYVKTAGAPTTVDFNLRCDSGYRAGDQGPFPISMGETRSYVFQVGSRGNCHGVLFDKIHGGQWNSPSLNR